MPAASDACKDRDVVYLVGLGLTWALLVWS